MKRFELWMLAGFSGIVTLILEKLFSPLIPWNKINVNILKYLAYPIPIYFMVIFGLIFLFFYFLFKKFFNKNHSLYSKKQMELQKRHSQTEIGGVLWKWDVEFDDDDKPYIEHLTPYCPNHGNPPLKMRLEYYSNEYNCIYNTCNNKVYLNMMPGIRNLLISYIEQDWDNIQKK